MRKRTFEWTMAKRNFILTLLVAVTAFAVYMAGWGHVQLEHVTQGWAQQ